MEGRVTIPHRHDHYCCFFLEKGVVDFSLDFQQLTIPSPSLAVSCPGQIHQLKAANGVAGWFLAFEATFVDSKARIVIEQSVANLLLLPLTNSDQRWFVYVFELIQASVEQQTAAPFHQQLLQTLINALFYKVAGLFQLQEDQRIQAYSTRTIEIARTFQHLVKEQFLVKKRPADYASQLNITVGHLNDAMKSVTGFASTYFIQHEIIREAQRLLFYTEKSVKEIAFQLGYEDYKYFIRLFRKTTGLSPTAFRKANKP